MWFLDKILSSAQISLILLLLVSFRLIPFDLLHYHDNQFANFEIISGSTDLQSASETIIEYRLSCSFDQYLSLSTTGFVLEINNLLIKPTSNKVGLTAVAERRSDLLHFDILNKGSPLLA